MLRAAPHKSVRLGRLACCSLGAIEARGPSVFTSGCCWPERPWQPCRWGSASLMPMRPARQWCLAGQRHSRNPSVAVGCWRLPHGRQHRHRRPSSIVDGGIVPEVSTAVIGAAYWLLWDSNRKGQRLPMDHHSVSTLAQAARAHCPDREWRQHHQYWQSRLGSTNRLVRQHDGVKGVMARQHVTATHLLSCWRFRHGHDLTIEDGGTVNVINNSSLYRLGTLARSGTVTVRGAELAVVLIAAC